MKQGQVGFEYSQVLWVGSHPEGLWVSAQKLMLKPCPLLAPPGPLPAVESLFQHHLLQAAVAIDAGDDPFFVFPCLGHPGGIRPQGAAQSDEIGGPVPEQPIADEEEAAQMEAAEEVKQDLSEVAAILATLVAHRQTQRAAQIIQRNERDTSNWKWVGRWERMQR